MPVAIWRKHEMERTVLTTFAIMQIDTSIGLIEQRIQDTVNPFYE